jgi:hypothetical protein
MKGVPPATVAEWTLEGDGFKDYYDGTITTYSASIDTNLSAVSLVDGFNLPMKITTNVNCPVASCGVDLGPKCKSLVAFRGTFV